MGAICKLASSIAESDRLFGKTSKHEFSGMHDLGSIRRVARQAKLIVDCRPNDVAYWRMRIAAQLGLGTGTGGSTGARGSTGAGGGGHGGTGLAQMEWVVTGDDHVVEAVQGRQITAADALEYWVKWSGSNERSWEPLTDLQGSMTLVGEYEVQRDGQHIVGRQPQMQPQAGQGAPQPLSEFSRALVALMDGQSDTQKQLQLLAEERADKKEKKIRVHDRCAWDRPVLKGDERRRKLGQAAAGAGRVA